MKHTPTPWTREGRSILSGNGNVLALGNLALPKEQSDANVEFIVLAANCHEELVAALQPIAAAYSDNPGTSDLDNEQPVTIALGDVRRAWAALGKAGLRS